MFQFIKNLFENKQIWRTTKREFLRKEIRYDNICGDVDTFSVYAEYQESLTSDKKRIKEVWELT